MSDIIRLLPDAIANQIAAGEVVQRPSSVVKELLENAIDAGAKEIKLIIKDSGKTLIQCIDDGKGMSETDARMAFERHATSKIASAHDLSFIKTMGFRGEALASIAAIAHVELITKREDKDVATRIVIQGSEIKTQEAASLDKGTSLAIKNLFFNVPARRKFLKSDPVEFKHILDEFQRVVLAHPELFFSLHHNGNEIYHLPAGKLVQRISGIFGKNIQEKVVPVKEDTDILKIAGYVGKPAAAKKTKGEQFIFVNRRFIKSAYLNHAIRSVFDEMINKEYYPFFVLFLEIDPQLIDVNVHPTKQEIKFEQERLIYNYIKVAVRHGIGQYTLTPQLNFDASEHSFVKQGFQSGPSGAGTKGQGFSFPNAGYEKNSTKNWAEVYEGLKNNSPELQTPITMDSQVNSDGELLEEVGAKSAKPPYQIHHTYIVNQIKSGFLLIDQQAASERILYEKMLKSIQSQEKITQQTLFPVTIELDAQKSELLSNVLDKINLLGFDIENFGNQSFIIRGVPSGMEANDKIGEEVIDLLDKYSNNLALSLSFDEQIAFTVASATALKRGRALTIEEMEELIDLLFACDIPYKSPSGRNCFITFELDELLKRFTN